jgi:hypothetical protein
MMDKRVKDWISAAGMRREYAVALGDERRNKRANAVGVALAKKPELSLPKVFADEAQLEGTYRLLGNDAIDWRDLLAPHVARTVERASQDQEVLIAHDTSDAAFRTYWPDELRGQMSSFSTRTQGFFLHTSLAITAHGPAMPLGVLDVQPYVHRTGLEPNDRESQEFWTNEGGLYANEQARWFNAIVLAGHDLRQRCLRPIHVMDCETDSYGMLSWLVQNQERFVVRGDGTRKLERGADFRMIGEITANLGERFALRSGSKVDAHPTRRAREAKLTVSAGTVTFKRAKKADDVSFSPGGAATQPMTMQIHLVEAVERNPPAGEKGVRWLLLTTEPIGTTAEVLQVITWYRRRWLVEEFFKSLKTGCRLEQRQMESMSSMLRMVALLLPAAWRLLLLRVMDTEAPDAHWSHLLTPLEYRILCRAVPKAKLGKQATVAQCKGAIAKLGGHLPRNGPPGWQTLHAGWRQLMDYVTGFRLARGDAINA